MGKESGIGRRSGRGNGKAATQQSLDAIVWHVCDIMRRSNCVGALQYVPELTWVLFLRILDEREEAEAQEAAAVGDAFTPSLAEPFRWRDWAAGVDNSKPHIPRSPGPVSENRRSMTEAPYRRFQRSHRGEVSRS